jgi:hypothetical protein
MDLSGAGAGRKRKCRRASACKGALVGHALDFLALEAIYQGEYARARLLVEEGLAAFKELESKTGIMSSARALACVMFFQGDLESARIVGEECLTLQKELGSKQSEAGGSPSALAKETGYSVDYLGWLVRQGRVAAMKRGRRWYSTLDAVRQYKGDVEAGSMPRGRPKSLDTF